MSTRHPFGPLKGVSAVTDHCLARFRERVGVTGSHGKVISRLERWLTSAREVNLKPKARLTKLLNHSCEEAVYYFVGNPFQGGGHILTVVKGSLVTVHRNDADEWDLEALK